MNFKKAIRLLQKNRMKLTERRKVIIQFFIDKKRYCTAKELNEYLSTIYDGISYDTIYRNLHAFVKIGILESTNLNGEKHFQIACSKNHHHHFICLDCGKSKKIPYCPLETVQESLNNYVVEDHKFEVYGFCPSCQSA